MPSSNEVKSRKRLHDFMEFADTAMIQYTAPDYTVFVARMQRERFEAMANELSRGGYRVSYGYRPLGSRPAVGKLYQYTVVVEEGHSEPVRWPEWLMKWLGK